MAFKNKLLLIEQSQKKIKSDRESIKKLGQTKKRNRNILHNITNSIRMELDTSPYQTIVTPGGLWIDYEPDLKKGKVEKFYNERVNEPFSKKYVKPDKEVMQLFMDDEFKVKLNEIHMATIEFTKFKEKDINEPDEGEGGEFGNGIGRDWDGNLSKPPAKGIIQARYFDYVPDPKYSNLVYRQSPPVKPGSSELKKLTEEKAKSKYDWKLVSYDSLGTNKNNKGKGYVFYVLFYQDYLDKNDTSASPEEIWEIAERFTGHYGFRMSIKDKGGKSYVLKWDRHKVMSRTRIDSDGKLFSQYLIQDSVFAWTRMIEKFGFEIVSHMNKIPLKNVKIFNEDDPNDIVYDGPPEDLL